MPNTWIVKSRLKNHGLKYDVFETEFVNTSLSSPFEKMIIKSHSKADYYTISLCVKLREANYGWQLLHGINGCTIVNSFEVVFHKMIFFESILRRVFSVVCYSLSTSDDIEAHSFFFLEHNSNTRLQFEGRSEKLGFEQKQQAWINLVKAKLLQAIYKNTPIAAEELTSPQEAELVPLAQKSNSMSIARRMRFLG